MKKWAFGVLSFILFLSIAKYLYTNHNQIAPTVKAKPILVQSTHVKEQSVPLAIKTTATAVNLHEIHLTPEIAGVITKLHFTEGQKVNQGDELISLDTNILQNDLMAANAKLKLSELNYKRIKALFNKKLSSLKSLDEANADFREKQSNVLTIKSKINKMTLKAPYSGIIGQSLVSPGEYVTIGQKLVPLVSKDKLRIQYHVFEKYLPLLKLKQKVTVESNIYPNKKFTAYVSYIDSSLDKDTRTVFVEAQLDNANNALSAGLYLHITHELSVKQHFVLVPEESLIPSLSGYSLFTIKDDHAEMKPVTVGKHYQHQVAILKGLKSSDEIVIRGQHHLTNGSLIKRIKS